MPISRVISPLKWLICMVTLLITPCLTAHEPPSRVTAQDGIRLQGFHAWGLEV